MPALAVAMDLRPLCCDDVPRRRQTGSVCCSARIAGFDGSADRPLAQPVQRSMPPPGGWTARCAAAPGVAGAPPAGREAQAASLVSTTRPTTLPSRSRFSTASAFRNGSFVIGIGGILPCLAMSISARNSFTLPT